MCHEPATPNDVDAVPAPRQPRPPWSRRDSRPSQTSNNGAGGGFGAVVVIAVGSGEEGGRPILRREYSVQSSGIATAESPLPGSVAAWPRRAEARRCPG